MVKQKIFNQTAQKSYTPIGSLPGLVFGRGFFGLGEDDEFSSLVKSFLYIHIILQFFHKLNILFFYISVFF